MELWKVTAWKDGCIWRTKFTGFDVPADAKVPADYTTASISLDRQTGDDGKLLEHVEINPHPTIGRPE